MADKGLKGGSLGLVAVIAGVLIATSVDTPTSTVGASSTRLHV